MPDTEQNPASRSRDGLGPDATKYAELDMVHIEQPDLPSPNSPEAPLWRVGASVLATCTIDGA